MTQIYVRDSLPVSELTMFGIAPNSPTSVAFDATLYVELVGKSRAKLLIVKEDGSGNAKLLGWRHIPIYQKGE